MSIIIKAERCERWGIFELELEGSQKGNRIFNMPKGISFKVDIIDTWNMSISVLDGTYEGEFRVDLPGRQYMAVRMRRAH